MPKMDEDKKSGTICRVCLNYHFEEHGKGLSLFDKYNNNNCVISDQINALTNVAIKEGDGFPDRICPTCLLELESAYNFKQKCENANEILLSAVNTTPTQFECLEVSLPLKEEYLDDDDFDYVDDNMTLADLQAAGADIKPHVEAPSKQSRAKDLKLECHDCGGSFKSKCKLRVHWKKVHMTEKLKCSNCLRKFKSFAAFESHKKRNLQSCATASKVRIEGEGRNRVFYCKDCNYKTVRIKDVAAHIIIHSGERPFQCDICLRSFTQHSSLSSHKEGAHKVYNTEGTCQYCGKHIQGRNKLYRHMERHRHNSFPCKVCDSVLKTRGSLQNHMKRHSGIKSYACEVCPTSFYTASELYNHKTKVHLKSKFYTCAICNYKSFSHSAMARHKSKHSASNVACNFCGTFLDNELQLVLHKKKHTDRHYPCPHCDKSYYSRKNLSSHIRKIHKIVKLRGCVATVGVNSMKSECSLEVIPCK